MAGTSLKPWWGDERALRRLVCRKKQVEQDRRTCDREARDKSGWNGGGVVSLSQHLVSAPVPTLKANTRLLIERSAAFGWCVRHILITRIAYWA